MRSGTGWLSRAPVRTEITTSRCPACLALRFTTPDEAVGPITCSLPCKRRWHAREKQLNACLPARVRSLMYRKMPMYAYSAQQLVHEWAVLWWYEHELRRST